MHKVKRWLALAIMLTIPATSLATPAVAGATLRISEVMASNNATLEDSFGQFSDWIEIVNQGSEPIDLSGMCLSDKEDKLDKYTFPAGTKLEPGAYLLLFASGLKNDLLPDERHVPFKLSAAEEAVYLSKDGEVLDAITFTEQESDVSLALDQDGTMKLTITPTPGWANQIVAPDGD
ncbi:MAG: lamin tail domain-containing protein [Candidatus Limiplasma sp.]|nr:lamin tail domain-containing protein [Candidatus Limiplasma sp.]MEA5144740.1 lamin tail domain-containing protein [Candidatus Limiplasma sp.]